MNLFCTEGLIISAFPYQNADHIVTLFTPNEGIVKLFSKGKGQSLAPMTRIETVYAKGRGELYQCREWKLLDAFLPLRQRLTTLEAAGHLLQAIVMTQAPGKAASELYMLLLAYLKKLPEASEPFVISSSFRLKVLRYEGLLGFPLQEEQWTSEESLIVEALALCRDFSLLAKLPVDLALARKVEQFFLDSLR